MVNGTRSRSDRRLARSLLPVLLLLPMAVLSATPVLDEADRLLRSGRAAEAAALLSAHEIELAGTARFDYLYGVAQLDNGQRALAVESLQRALANAPDDPAARLELGRALYESGDRVASRHQFDRVLAGDPPPRIRDTALGYLRAMEPRTAPGSGWIRAFEWGAGWDSNANASTNDSDFFGIVLDPTNVQTDSAYSSVSLRADGRMALGERNRLSVAARIGHRWNEDAGFVDQSLASLGGVLEFGDGPTVFSLGAGGTYGLLDGDPHQRELNGDVGLSHRFAGGWLARGLLRYGELRYDADFGSLSTLDVDRLTAALGLWRAVGNVDYGLTAIAGRDDPRASGSPYENDRYGFQADAGLRTSAGHGLRFQLVWQDIDYDDDPPFFTVLPRRDEFWSISLGGEIRDWPARGISLLPNAGYVSNRSSISLYQYDRFTFGLTLQKTF